MIPLKIETLLEGKVVEQNRVEYKQGWNPSTILHTICAFANDFANVNGGYIVIGIQEKQGIPVLPPIGIHRELLDSIQQEIFQYCNQIEPRYIPMIEVVNYPDENTHLIYMKCSPGDAGPYRAPKEVYTKGQAKGASKTLFYWIRPSSLTTIAKQNEISELFEKFNSVPFDDRVNRMATLDMIRRGYLEDFLRDSNSSLAAEINERSMEDLLLSLEVANESDGGFDLRNIAVLMFAERPDKIIPGAQIDLVRFNTVDAEAADDFFEKTFTGPIWKQVHDVLDYIKTNVIEEKVVKVTNQAEAERYFNYPYNALEEVIVNAIFHKSYREDFPVEVRIYVDKIMIINFPGPDKWMDMSKFAKGKLRARKYRNRRIGEFFKEIDLSEKQSTGIPKILRELKRNGSPEPIFETTEDRIYIETTIFIREGFLNNSNVSDINMQPIDLSDTLSNILSDIRTPSYGTSKKSSDICISNDTHSDNLSDKPTDIDVFDDKLSDITNAAEQNFYQELRNIFKEKPFVTTKMMSEITGMPASTTRRYLSKFCKINIIKAVGKNKGTRYYNI